MTAAQRPTDPLRGEHRDLLRHLLVVDAARNDVAGWDRDIAARAFDASLSADDTTALFANMEEAAHQ